MKLEPAAKFETEKQFQGAVVELAEAQGWLVYHVPDSRQVAGTGKGFPDLVMAHRARAMLVICENKTEKGQLTPEQKRWLDALTAVAEALQSGPQRPTDHFQVCVLRPRHWPMIEAILTGDARG